MFTFTRYEGLFYISVDSEQGSHMPYGTAFVTLQALILIWPYNDSKWATFPEDHFFRFTIVSVRVAAERVTRLRVVLYFIWPALGSEANIAFFFRLDDLSLPLFSPFVLRLFISKISVFILFDVLNPIYCNFTSLVSKFVSDYKVLYKNIRFLLLYVGQHRVPRCNKCP
jgi:hypothetical protein